MSGFFCQECGHAFKTVKAAEKASFGDSGCPKCGGSDIDFGKPRKSEPGERELEGYAKRAAVMGSDFLDHDHSMDH